MVFFSLSWQSIYRWELDETIHLEQLDEYVLGRKKNNA